MPESESNESVAPTPLFATTHWSVVQAAGDSGSPQADEALAQLCRVYWYPLYAYVRRRGYAAHDAQDLTQEFFARFLRCHYFAVADRRRGKFRSFLLASLKHFLAHEWEKTRAQKRGGAHAAISLDLPDGETRYTREPADELTPDKIYDRRWVLTLFEQALARVREDYTAGGKRELFLAIEPALTGEKGLASYAEISARLGMSEGALKVAVHRLREHYRDALLAVIAQTVSSPEEAQEELRYLAEVLGQS